MIYVLVTGANGQLGKTIQDLAVDYTNINFVFKTSHELDITDDQAVKAVLSEFNYDYCINCAAYTNVEEAEKTSIKAFLVNGEAVKYLALSCKSNNTILIHISTDYVFDGEKRTPYTVKDIPNPINEYGKSKLKGEKYIQETWSNHFIIRTSWLYNKNHGQNFYRNILRLAKSQKNLNITDGQLGCPTSTVTLSEFIIENIILGNLAYGLYHFTDGKEMTWYDFALVILTENGLEKEVNLVKDRNYRTFARRPKNSTLKNTLS